ncbi:MAG: CoA transferase [Acidimicrobiia bacterium]|nr:CoA transferase [Acidimicrobiia bacterium]
MSSVTDRPLTGFRVVDLADGKGELCGRLLADLGADVIRVEPPGGASSRMALPAHGGASLWFAFRNAGKRSVMLDLDVDDDRSRLHDLLATADVLIDSAPPGSRLDQGLDPRSIADRHPHLVVLGMTDFGATGPYAGYVATDSTIHALAGMVFKAGVPEREPLLMPGTIAYDAASVTAAFAVLCALWQARSTHAGQVLDFSVTEAVAQLSDWSMPNAAVQIGLGMVPNEIRQGSGPVYAIFGCQGGYVRLVILSPRQWQAMRAWLGEPEYLQDPELDSFVARFGIADAVLNPLYEEHFSTMTMEEVSAEAQRRGIVCTPVLTPADVLANEHFASRDTFMDVEVADGVQGRMPSGFWEIDGQRQGPRGPVPTIGQHTAEVYADLGPARPAPDREPEPGLPLQGLRAMDFGHGGVGVEAGRMLAEYGAEVIKIESRSYIDFIRAVAGSEMSPSFASSSRSKKSLGVNAKTEAGVELLRQMAAHSHIVIENNSTGTMDEMGLGFADLTEVNPEVVMVSSQLMGSRGDWAAWKGYGPNTQPTGGLVHLWDYEVDGPPAGSGSIFPDHLAGRLCAVGSLAALLGKERHGVTAHVEVAQIETVTGMLGDLLLQESLAPGSVGPTGNRRIQGAPWGMYRCDGAERWIAICVATDQQWAGLVDALGRPEWALDPSLADATGRHARADLIDEHLGAFTATRDRYDVQRLLQDHGVPAGVMLTGGDQLEDPHLLARGYVVELDQQGSGHLALDGPAFRATGMTDPIITEAPLLGEHTVSLCRDLLGLDAAEIDRLFAAEVLETTDPDNLPEGGFPF